MVISALERGVKKHLMLPDGEFERGSLYRGHFPLSGRRTLSGGDAASHRPAAHSCRRSRFPTRQLRGAMSSTWTPISSHVKGQSSAKRALEIAAAGGHNVLLIGPPGSGKTLMARCMPSILPDMTFSPKRWKRRAFTPLPATIPPSGLLTERPVSIAASHRVRTRRWSAAATTPCPEKSAKRTMEFCFWTSYRNTGATYSKRCASRWRTDL